MAHNVVLIPMPDGRIRRFTYRRPMVVDGLRREYKNGDPVTLRDIVRRPVKTAGTFPLRDMLNLRSVEALFVAYRHAEEASIPPAAKAAKRIRAGVTRNA